MSIDDFFDPEYKSRFDPFSAYLVYSACFFLSHLGYHYIYKNTSNLAQFRDKEVPVMLLPNHQLNLDIVVEDVLVRKALGRFAYFLMRGSLPKWFERLGGIGIARSKELAGLSRAQLSEAGLKSKRMAEFEMLNLLYRNEVVVVHTEGIRRFGLPMQINYPNIKNLVELQHELGSQINYVPVEITYSSRRSLMGYIPFPFSSIFIDVKRPITVPDKGYLLLKEMMETEFNPSRF